MPLNTPLPKVTFTNIAKHPIVYAVIILALLVGYFVNSFTDTSAQRHVDCLDQVIYLRTMNDRKDSFILNLRTEIAVKDLLIKSIPSIVDSISEQKKEELKK